MLASGIGIIDALQVTVDHSINDAMSIIAAELQSKISTGHRLSSAMSDFPRVFSPVSIALIRLGESNGQIIEQLRQLSTWMDRDEKLRRKVIAALTYPTFALLITGLLTMALFLTVVPGFIEMFEEMKIELPFATKVLAAATSMMTSPLAWAVFCFGGLMSVMLSKDLFESPAARLRIYTVLLSLPVFGSLLQSTAIARFAFAASAMLMSGSNVVTGFRLAAETTGSPLIEIDADRLVESLEEGRQLSEHMADRPDIYPRICTQLTAVGEESARLPKMFNVMAEHYEEHIDHQIQVATSLLEPMLMSIVAVVVGFIVMGIFLPMYSFVAQIGN